MKLCGKSRLNQYKFCFCLKNAIRTLQIIMTVFDCFLLFDPFGVSASQLQIKHTQCFSVLVNAQPYLGLILAIFLKLLHLYFIYGFFYFLLLYSYFHAYFMTSPFFPCFLTFSPIPLLLLLFIFSAYLPFLSFFFCVGISHSSLYQSNQVFQAGKNNTALQS